jgi:hypothetical protein
MSYWSPQPVLPSPLRPIGGYVSPLSTTFTSPVYYRDAGIPRPWERPEVPMWDSRYRPGYSVDPEVASGLLPLRTEPSRKPTYELPTLTLDVSSPRLPDTYFPKDWYRPFKSEREADDWMLGLWKQSLLR